MNSLISSLVIGGSLLTQSAIQAGGGGSQVLVHAHLTPPGTTETWTGTAGTLVHTYNPDWVDISTSFTVAQFSLAGGNVVLLTHPFAGGGAMLSTSSSDIAQIVFKATPAGDQNPEKYVCVRNNGVTPGYCLFPCYGGPNDTVGRLCTYKNESEFKQGPADSYDLRTNHVARIEVSGTTTVTIKLYWDGVLIDTATDSSPLPQGHPGFMSGGPGNVLDAQFGAFQDF